jgi:HK97 family phage portal protein
MRRPVQTPGLLTRLRLAGKIVRGTDALFGKAQDDRPGWDVLVGYKGAGIWESADNPWNTYSEVERERAYGKNEIVYACVRELYTTAAEAPLVLERPVADGWDPVQRHWVLDLLSEPNDVDSETELVQVWVMRWVLGGKSFIWKWRSSGGRVGQLWPVPTSWVKIKPGNTAKGEALIKGYKLRQGRGQEITVEPRDMFYTRFPDPESIYDGLGPLQAASRGYQLDDELGRYLVEMLVNTPVPGVAWPLPVGTQAEELRAIRAQIEDRVGRGKRGSISFYPAGMEGGADAKPTQYAPLADLDMPGLESLSESRICAAFGVPPAVVQLRVGMNPTYSNYQEARQSFYKETMRPLWWVAGEALTRGLLRAEGERQLRLRFDIGEIPELQEDMTAVEARVGSGLTRGGLTRNEYREALDLEPTEGPDVWLIPLGTREVPVGAEGQPPPAPPQRPGEDEDEDEEQETQDEEQEGNE